jgi:hypothetical protein
MKPRSGVREETKRRRPHLAAGNSKPLELVLNGETAVLEPGGAIELPWTLSSVRNRSR